MLIDRERELEELNFLLEEGGCGGDLSHPSDL